MIRHAVRVGVVCGVGTLAAAACQVNRERPGPPRVTVTIDQDSVASPDTLTGSVEADDPDGLDSIWISVDSAPPVGLDGLFKATLMTRFQGTVRGGHQPGDRVPLSVRARDISGFTGGLDTSVPVRGP